MRRITRAALANRILSYLARKQAEVNSGKQPRRLWENARKTRTMRKVAVTLSSMTGSRERCMYCEDSRGTQIDHFCPLAHDPSRAFVWENMLWLCGGCNQKKGDQFELSETGEPLLIDPTEEDPWDFLFFEPHTGNITARIDPASGIPDPKGEYTTDPAVLPLNIEPVTDGRRRTYRSLRGAVQRFLDRVEQTADATMAISELLEEIRDHDDSGLTNWYFRRDGSGVPPFSVLRERHREVWQAITHQLARG